MHESNCFVTLTYDDDHLPSPPSLVKRDLQLFYKRLRKSGRDCRYYSCGEYGETTARPHYHACIFGLDFSDDRVPWSRNAQGDQLYISPTLARIWGQGNCLIGDLTFESAAYVARYCMKKVTGKGAADHYHAIDEDTGESVKFLPEFTVMSRRPGIGRKWYDKFKSDLYPSDFALTNTGNKLSVPKYYDYLLEQESPEVLEQLKAARKDSARERVADNSPRRLRDREIVKKAQLGQLKRGL